MTSEKFFVPGIENDDDKTEQIYDAIKKFSEKKTGLQILDIRIQSIEYYHNGNKYYAEVGKYDEFVNDLVLAILKTSKAYLICTKNRGGIRGEPILVGLNNKISVTTFK